MAHAEGTRGGSGFVHSDAGAMKCSDTSIVTYLSPSCKQFLAICISRDDSYFFEFTRMPRGKRGELAKRQVGDVATAISKSY